MEYLILFILFAVIASQIYILKKFKTEQKMVVHKIIEKPHKTELTQEQKEKQEKLREHFENLMGYDYDKALRKKE